MPMPTGSAASVAKDARHEPLSRRAIARAIVELGNPPMLSGVAIRKPGGGRKRTMEQDETLVRDLERLIEPLSRGDPDDPLFSERFSD